MITTCESKHVLLTLQPERGAMVRRLRVLRRMLRRRLLVRGFVKWIATLLVACATSFLVDRWLRFETATRVTFASAAGVGLLVLAWHWIGRPLRLRLHDLDLAEVIERRRAGLGQRITDVLQLPDLLATPQFASPSLVRQAVLDHVRELEQIDLRTLVDARRHARQLLLLIGLALVPLVVAVAWPQMAELWARRWLLGRDIRWPQATYLTLEGLGDNDRLLTPRGESVVLHLNAQPVFSRVDNGWRLSGRGKPLVVEAEEPPRRIIPDQIGVHYRSTSGTARQANFTRFEGADFRYELPPLVEPLELEISGGDDWFGPVHVEPIDRPTVVSLVLVARPPGSTSEERHQVGSSDDRLMFLPQTQLELNVTASEPLEKIELLRQDQTPERLEAVDATTFRMRWMMQAAHTVELRLVAAESGLVSKPYFLTLGLLQDREPRLTVRSSGVGKRITPKARVPLTLHAADDFGIGEIGLEVERTEVSEEKPKTTSERVDLDKFVAERNQPLPLSIDRSPSVQVAEYSFTPGQALRLRAFAQDRCVLEMHTGMSRWLTFQVVTPEQLFYEILMRQRQERTAFAAAVKSAESQKDLLATLSAVDGVSSVVRSHQAISRQVRQVAIHLAAILQEITLNDLGDPTERQLLEEKIIKPLRELESGPLAQLHSRLEELAAGDKIDETEHAAANQLQQEIVHTMQQILAQMSHWESFVDAVNQLNRIIELQKLLEKGTEEVKKKQIDELLEP